MKQNFFDELSGSWGDILDDTYEKHNKIIFIDEKRNVYLQIDPNVDIIKDDSKSYIERYNITNNPNYYVDLEMRVDNFTAFGKDVMFILNVYDSTIENDRKKIITSMTVSTDNRYPFTPDLEDRRIQVDREFMNSFIRRGYNKVTSKPENKHIFKFSNSLQAILNNLGANALQIK